VGTASDPKETKLTEAHYAAIRAATTLPRASRALFARQRADSGLRSDCATGADWFLPVYQARDEWPQRTTWENGPKSTRRARARAAYH